MSESGVEYYGKFIDSFWKNEHGDPIENDNVPNDIEIIFTEFANRTYSLDPQGIESEDIGEPTHNRLWRKDYVRSFKTPVYKGIINTKYGPVEIITPLVDEQNEKSFIAMKSSTISIDKHFKIPIDLGRRAKENLL